MRRGLDTTRCVGSFFLVLAAVYACLGLEITRLTVPDYVLNGSRDSVLLDCEYEFDPETDEKLVVKWFHEDHPEPVYQWIPEFDTVHHSEKYRVNPDYQVPTGDPYTRSRALNILRPTTEMSGRYSCQVTSLLGADFKEDCMVVYAEPTSVNINYTSIADDMILVYCEVEGVFPLPEISMFEIGPLAVDPTPVDDVSTDYELEDEGAYDVIVATNISERGLSPEGLSYFGCEVKLTGTDYSKVVKIPYFPAVVAEKQEGDDDDDDDDSNAYRIQSETFLMTGLISLLLLLT